MKGIIWMEVPDEDDNANVTSKIGESSAESSTRQKEDPNKPMEDDGTNAALELEKVSFVSINVNPNQITLTTVILLFRGVAI